MRIINARREGLGTIRPMSADFRRASRLALWVAVWALLLKAAVPLLASTAAGLRGVSVAEVCHVYGVALPAPSGGEHAAHGHHRHAHDGGESDTSHADAGRHADHCALSALAALAPPDAPPATGAASAGHEAVGPCRLPAPPRDACATWVAQRKQGPPATA